MDKIEEGKKIAEKMLEKKQKERQKKIEQGKEIVKKMLEKKTKEKEKKIEEGKEILNEYKKKKNTKKQIDAAIVLQSAIKRIQPNILLGRQMELELEKKYEEIDKSVPIIQAAIKRKLIKKPTEEFFTGKKNIYPQAPIYKIDKLKEAVRSVMKSMPETKGEIKLNTTKSNMIQFLSKYKYPLSDIVSSFKTEKKKECPEGKVLNPLTKRCINIKKPKESKKCPEGKVLNPLTNRCINIKK